MPGGVVHVVQNGYFGEEKKFELYAQSALRETVQQRGGKTLFLPDLADRVTDELYSKRITLAEATQQLKLGDRAELQRWRSSVGPCLRRWVSENRRLDYCLDAFELRFKYFQEIAVSQVRLRKYKIEIPGAECFIGGFAQHLAEVRGDGQVTLFVEMFWG